MKPPFQKDRKLDLSSLQDWPRKVGVSGKVSSGDYIKGSEGTGKILVAVGVK